MGLDELCSDSFGSLFTGEEKSRLLEGMSGSQPDDFKIVLTLSMERACQISFHSGL